MSDIRDELAQAISANFNACRGAGGVSPVKLADAIMPLVKRAQAEALRDAANILDHDAASSLWEMWDTADREYMTPVEWLGRYADRIEQGAESFADRMARESIEAAEAQKTTDRPIGGQDD